MGLDSLLFAALLDVAGRVGSVLASQSSRISKRVTGTQSLSISAKLMVGKRNTQASRMYVPAHVGCTLRLTLVMSLYKTLLTGGEPPSSSLRVLRPFLRVRVSKFLED